jgi:hypothetical protein
MPTIVGRFCLVANVSKTRAGAVTAFDEDFDRGGKKKTRPQRKECVSGTFVVS